MYIEFMVKAKLKKIMSIVKYQQLFLFKLEIQSTNFVVFASRDTFYLTSLLQNFHRLDYIIVPDIMNFICNGN